MRLRVETVELPLRAPFVSATGSVTKRELLRVELEGADGVVGYGEAAPLESYDGVSIESARAGIEDCRGLLAASDGTDRERLLAACWQAAVLPQSVAAIDLALWDLAGRRASQPVWKLLGAVEPWPVEVNATIASADRAGASAEAAAAARAGFGCIKVKVGSGMMRDVWPRFARRPGQMWPFGSTPTAHGRWTRQSPICGCWSQSGSSSARSQCPDWNPTGRSLAPLGSRPRSMSHPPFPGPSQPGAVQPSA